MNTSTATRPDDDTFEARLRTGLDQLAADTPVPSPGRFDPDALRLTALATPEAVRSRGMAPSLAAAAVAAVTVAGLVLLATRDDQSDTPLQPAATATPVAPSVVASPPVDQPMAPGGALIPGALPASLADATISAGGRLGPTAPPDAASDLVRRWYTSTLTLPEASAWIALDSFPSDRMAPDAIGPVEQISVQGVVAELYEPRWIGDRAVTFTLNGTTYVLSGANLTDAELLQAAEHVGSAPDGYGAVIEDEGLVSGLAERAAGGVFETWFLDRSTFDAPSPSLRVDGADASAWMTALHEDVELLDLHRLGFATVADITIHGQPAFTTTIDIQTEYRGVTWHEDGVTYLLGSNGLTDDEVIELAEALRPAALAEWDELIERTDALASAAAESAPTPTTESLDRVEVSAVEQIHTVVEGDNLTSIAGRYGFPDDQVAAIAEYNGWANAEIVLVPGSTVRIPPGAVVVTDG